MTDLFFGGEGGEKEAGHQFSVIAESPPTSFSPPSQKQQHTVIASEDPKIWPQCEDDRKYLHIMKLLNIFLYLLNFQIFTKSVIGRRNDEAIC
jgi:hypothetical protein